MTTAVTRFEPVPKEERSADAVSSLLEALGEDPDRDGLRRTPERVARSLAFLTSGMRRTPRDAVGEGIFEGDYQGQVLVRDIEFYSLCEHHMLPFRGVVHVAYLPAGRILGLSKLPRLVEVFARRLQVQERLTDQVARAVDQILSPRGVAVVVEAEHFCMLMRGVEKQQSRTRSSVFLGAYETDPALRAELLMAIGPQAAPAAATPVYYVAPPPAQASAPHAHAHPALSAPGHPGACAAGAAAPLRGPSAPARPDGRAARRRDRGGEAPRGHRCWQCAL